MTTDHDLDARLRAAGGVRDEDMPQPPEAFLDYLHTVTTAADADPASDRPRLLPAVADAEPASVLAARQLVADARTRQWPKASARRFPLTRRRTVELLAAGVAAAAVVGALIAVTDRSDSPRSNLPVAAPSGVALLLADYSSTPTRTSEQRLAEINAACAASLAAAVAPPTGPDYADQSPATITEVRDAWGLAVFDGEQNLALCLAHRTDDAGETIESISVQPPVSAAVTSGVSTDAVTHAPLGAGERMSYTAMVGRTAPDVDHVDVRLANGQSITATVSNGWWAAWWPSDDSAGVQAQHLAYTTAGGQTATAAVSAGN